MQNDSPRGADAQATLSALRRDAAALQHRAAQLTAASAQVERRLGELVARRPSAAARMRDAARIAELRELGRESLRLLDAAVRRRELLRRKIEDLERMPVMAPVTRSEPEIKPVAPAAPEESAAVKPPTTPPPLTGPTTPTATAPLPPTPEQPEYVPIRRQQLDRLPPDRRRVPAFVAAAFRYAITAFLGVLLLVLAALLTPLPELFGVQVYAVQTGSMEPAIPVGSLIAVQRVRAADLSVGDVITFSERTRPDVLVTHRIVSLETRDDQRVAVTKGDANNTTDAWNVPLSEAIGRVVLHIPNMGYVLAALGSTSVKLAALALAGLMLTLPALRGRLGGAVHLSPRATQVDGTPLAPGPAPISGRSAAPLTAPQATVAPPRVASAAGLPPAPTEADASVTEEALDDPDVSFDALANEIDALLGRIASGDGASPRRGRDPVSGRRG